MSERLSNPNIFIAHNRSDAFAGEETQVRAIVIRHKAKTLTVISKSKYEILKPWQNEVKAQHMDRAVQFLVDELGVCANKSEAEDRIFFISAKEAVQARVQEAKGLTPQISTEDFFPRYLEFQVFWYKCSADMRDVLGGPTEF